MWDFSLFKHVRTYSKMHTSIILCIKFIILLKHKLAAELEIKLWHTLFYPRWFLLLMEHSVKLTSFCKTVCMLLFWKMKIWTFKFLFLSHKVHVFRNQCTFCKCVIFDVAFIKTIIFYNTVTTLQKILHTPQHQSAPDKTNQVKSIFIFMAPTKT